MRNVRIFLLVTGELFVFSACALSVWWQLPFQAMLFGVLSVGGVVGLAMFPLRFEVQHDSLTIIQLVGCRRFAWTSIKYVSRLPGPLSVETDVNGHRKVSRRPGMLIIKVGARRILLTASREQEEDRLALITAAQLNGVAVSTSV